MIARILFSSLILFALHNLAVFLVGSSPDPKWLKPASMFQENMIMAQQYMYEKKGSEVVIVGSSLARKLSTPLSSPFLPPDSFNLSLDACTVYDGLEIIRRCGGSPRIILVETNRIYKRSNPVFTDALFRPVLYPLRQYLPGLREIYQPVNMIARPLALAAVEKEERFRGMAMGVVAARLPGFRERGETLKEKEKEKSSGALKQKAALLESLLKTAAGDYAKAPGKDELDRSLSYLKEYLTYFEGKGATVMFFEMPEHSSLYDSNRLRAIRSFLADNFPSGRYVYLPSVEWKDYTTIDATHLDWDSAARYARSLTNALRKNLE